MTGSDLDKDAIRARLAAATPGPWSFGGIGVASLNRRIAMTCLDSEQHLRRSLVGYGAVRDQDVANGEFIAHAPTDVADLLDALEAAEAERADAFDQGAAAMREELRDPDGPGRPFNPYRESEANDDNNLRTWREETQQDAD